MCIKNLQQLKKRQKQVLADQKKHPRKIIVCCGPGCLACGSQKIVDTFKKSIKRRRIKNLTVEAVVETGCHGLCEQGPLVVIEPDGLFYTKVKTKHVDEILDRSIRKNEVVESLLYSEPSTNEIKVCRHRFLRISDPHSPA